MNGIPYAWRQKKVSLWTVPARGREERAPTGLGKPADGFPTTAHKAEALVDIKTEKKTGGLTPLVFVAAVLTACGWPGPSAPSAPDDPLTGTWRGSMTIMRTDLPTTVAATTWTFRPLAQTSGTTYTATATIHDPWLNVQATLSPTAIAGAVRASGFFTSPRGCGGHLGLDATLKGGQIAGSIDGVDCPQFPDTAVFRGTIQLTKEGR